MGDAFGFRGPLSWRGSLYVAANGLSQQCEAVRPAGLVRHWRAIQAPLGHVQTLVAPEDPPAWTIGPHTRTLAGLTSSCCGPKVAATTCKREGGVGVYHPQCDDDTTALASTTRCCSAAPSIDSSTRRPRGYVGHHRGDGGGRSANPDGPGSDLLSCSKSRGPSKSLLPLSPRRKRSAGRYHQQRCCPRPYLDNERRSHVGDCCSKPSIGG